MQEQDKIQFSKSMAELGISFNRNVDRETLAVYFKHLSSQTIYQVCRAIDDIIASDEKFPTVSRVKAMANIQKRNAPRPMQNVEQIEEVVHSNDLPRTKEDFFKAMSELTDKVDINK